MDVNNYIEQDDEKLIRWCLEDIIEEQWTEEDIARILAPVHARILAGEFDQKPPELSNNAKALACALITLTVGAMLSMTVNEISQ